MTINRLKKAAVVVGPVLTQQERCDLANDRLGPINAERISCGFPPVRWVVRKSTIMIEQGR